MRTGADRRRENYHRARQELIKVMGGVCKGCGTTTNLEFHHLVRRDWIPSKTARWVRLARYRREYHEGKVELRCRSCNARLGKPPPLLSQDPIPD